MKSFPRGIHPKGNKELTKDKPIELMPAPKKVYVSLLQHIGAIAKPIVIVGDTVKKGQPIAQSTGFISANIFSSCSGQVVAIQERLGANGKCEHIVIENDGKETEFNFAPLTNPSANEIVKRLDECGIVGMGGAGFPTKVKLSPKEKIDYFIINAAECEPYITCDYRIMLEQAESFLIGANYLAQAVGLNHFFVGIEDNKIDAAEHLKKEILRLNLKAEVVVCPTKYPQGAEKQLIYAITGRKVPTGKLPSAVGCVVNNVHTALSAYKAIKHGKTLYERVLTVTGLGIKQPKNLMVRNGTLYEDIIAFCGGLSDLPTVKMINGGPMMGIGVLNDSCSATKTTSCILLMAKEEAFVGRPNPCINCGKCARACPMFLMPMYIDAYSLVGDIDNAVKYGAMNCIECGCCAYVCPAKRPLTQSIRLAKKKYKDGGKK